MVSTLIFLFLGLMFIFVFLNNKEHEKKHGVASVVNNLPPDYDGPIDTWPIGRYTHYYYKVFDEKEKMNDIYYTKIFKDKGDTSSEMFQAILRGIPKGRLPYIKGIRKIGGEDKIIYGDALDCNILSAGTTQGGKTNNARVYLLSLMYFAHPEYLKIMIADPKAAAFKHAGKIVNLAREKKDILRMVDILYDEMMRRKKILGNIDHPGEDAKGANAYAYKHRVEFLKLPYIAFLFDEYADFSIKAKKGKCQKSKDAIIKIQDLASQGLGLGIFMYFIMQAPYSDAIKGIIKNNFDGRMTFSLGDGQHAHMVLGKQKPGDGCPTTDLSRGEFFFRQNGKRIKYRAPYCSGETLAKAVERLEKGGYNYKLIKDHQ